MSTKYKNIKTTCNEKNIDAVLPQPTARLVAAITGTTESYVKKVHTGHRADKSPKAQTVKYCYELIIGGQEVLVKEVSKVIAKVKSQTPQNL